METFSNGGKWTIFQLLWCLIANTFPPNKFHGMTIKPIEFLIKLEL